MICDTTFCDLKFKDVVNICDGRRLGRIIDMVIDTRIGKVKGIVLPGSRGFNIFRAPEDIFVPWNHILRIGEDVILIEILFDKALRCSPKKENDGHEGPDCYDDDIKHRVMKYLDEKEE